MRKHSAECAFSIIRRLSTAIAGTMSPLIPCSILLYSTVLPVIHSIILRHSNALIFQHNFFLPTVKARPSVRQIFSLLISKENLRDSNFARFRQLSPSIGRFFASSIARRILPPKRKRPSAPIALGVHARHVCVLPAIDPIGKLGCGGVEGHTANKDPRSEMVTRRQRRNGSVH